jgi:CBS domain-containing protein
MRRVFPPSDLDWEAFAVSVNTNEWQQEHPWEPSPTSHPQPVPLVSPADLFNPMLTIADVMTRQAPTCSADATVAEAVRILRESAASAVFVVAEGRPVGWLTDRTVALAVADRPDNPGQFRVRDLMKTDVPTVSADSRLGVLLDKFTDAGVAVPDLDGRMQGVVRWIDLLGPLSERALGKLVVRLFQHGHGGASERAR